MPQERCVEDDQEYKEEMDRKYYNYYCLLIVTGKCIFLAII